MCFKNRCHSTMFIVCSYPDCPPPLALACGSTSVWNNYQKELVFFLLFFLDETVEDLSDLDVNHTPQCDFTEYPRQCTQQWYFTLVLNVDETSATNDRPIDATGKVETRFFFPYVFLTDSDVTTCPEFYLALIWTASMVVHHYWSSSELFSPTWVSMTVSNTLHSMNSIC